MSERTSFGVVIPTYQRHDTIIRAVDSVLDQSHRALSLIVVDDGSTDGTADLLASVSDDRFGLIRQENSGRCHARNVGAQTLDAPWLVFLDSDDELMPDALRNLDDLILSTHSDLVVGATLKQAPDGSVTRRGCSWDDRRRLPDALSAGAFVISRALFDSVGGYCTNLEFSEHTEMVFRMRLLPQRPSVSVTEEALVRVHEREGRYSARVQLQTALHLLDHIAPALDKDRHARSMFYGIAGVSEAKLGNSKQARRYLAHAFVDHPRPRSALRLAYALVPGGVGRWAQGSREPASRQGDTA